MAAKQVWDGSNISAEISSSTVTNKYTRGINLIRDNLNFFMYNAHGDVVQLLNTSGIITKGYKYDAFGNERNINESDANPWRYCGEYFDLSSGTYYLRNRYYQPSTGRFTQEDPICAGLNWYTYCSNDPVNRIDPWGLKDEKLKAMAQASEATITYDEKTRTATVTIGNGNIQRTQTFTDGEDGVYIDKDGNMIVEGALFADKFGGQYWEVTGEGFTGFKLSISVFYKLET